jgi:SAM-dependent methyltransferase
MHLLSINPYDIEVCQQIVQAHYLSKIKQKFGCYTINDYNKFLQFDDVSHKRNTPRLSLITAIIPCASFYYLEYLKELQAEKIVDIGCGMNFFKDIVPNVIGIDTDEKADINDLFDAQFSACVGIFEHCHFRWTRISLNECSQNDRKNIC